MFLKMHLLLTSEHYICHSSMYAGQMLIYYFSESRSGYEAWSGKKGAREEENQKVEYVSGGTLNGVVPTVQKAKLPSPGAL